MPDRRTATTEPEANTDPSPSIPLVASIAGNGDDRDGHGGGGGAGPRSDSATVVPAGPGGVAGMIDAIIGFAADGTARVLRPEAAATVVTSFGFPIALAALVLLFLLVQPRLDDRDPKLRHAPRTLSDTLVAFEDDPA